MDVRLQAKLLRAIHKRVIDRVGGGKPIPVDIRIIATSNLALAVCVEDLLYRLNGGEAEVTPLRERPADILSPVSMRRRTPSPHARFRRKPPRPIVQCVGAGHTAMGVRIRRDRDLRPGRAHLADIERDLILDTLGYCRQRYSCRRHPRHLDPHLAQQAERICGRRPRHSASRRWRRDSSLSLRPPCPHAALTRVMRGRLCHAKRVPVQWDG
jgi:hypothetical protein